MPAIVSHRVCHARDYHGCEIESRLKGTMVRLVRILGRVLGAFALAVLAALVGFAASLLRHRPPTSYATSLRQPPQHTGPNDAE
jgi:hypothetical protein